MKLKLTPLSLVIFCLVVARVFALTPEQLDLFRRAAAHGVFRPSAADFGDFPNPLVDEQNGSSESEETLHPLDPRTAALWREATVPRSNLNEILEIEGNVKQLEQYAAELRKGGKDPSEICIFVVQHGLTWTAFAKGMVNAALDAGFTVVPSRYGIETPDRSLEKAVHVLQATNGATLLARYHHVRTDDSGRRESAFKAFAEWFKEALIQEFQKEIWKRRGKEFVDVTALYITDRQDGLLRKIKMRQLVKSAFLGAVLGAIYFTANMAKEGYSPEKALLTATAFRFIAESTFQYTGRAHSRVTTRKEWRPNLKDVDTEPVRYYTRTYFRSAPTSVLTQWIYHGTAGTLASIVFDPLWNSLVGLPTKFWRQIVTKNQKGLGTVKEGKIDKDDTVDTKLLITEMIQGVLKDGALIGLDVAVSIHKLFNGIAAGGILYELRKRYIPNLANRSKSWGYRFVRRTQKDLALVGSALRWREPAHECTLLLLSHEIPASGALRPACPIHFDGLDLSERDKDDNPYSAPDPDDEISRDSPNTTEGVT